ncbi:hypothetical protein FQN54_005471 [Arachnomyces sp. PD_36]|nr:hypothetical protein FQN54_005471 [Arachnomyces sp. PD_36]
MLQTGCREDRFLILSFYDEERKVLSQLLHNAYNHKGIQIKSVDASQGSESKLVMLSTTRPGRGTGLGFITDIRRQCVALSRALDGLIIVGDEKMGNLKSRRPSAGVDRWGELVNHHRYFNRLINVAGDYAMLYEKLSIPNAETYTLVVPK